MYCYETDEDKTAAVEIALSGDGIEELKAFFDTDHAEAVVEMVNVSVSVSPANENTHEVRVLMGQSIEEQLTKLIVRTNVPARINKMVVILRI